MNEQPDSVNEPQSTKPKKLHPLVSIKMIIPLGIMILICGFSLYHTYFTFTAISSGKQWSQVKQGQEVEINFAQVEQWATYSYPAIAYQQVVYGNSNLGFGQLGDGTQIPLDFVKVGGIHNLVVKVVGTIATYRAENVTIYGTINIDSSGFNEIIVNKYENNTFLLILVFIVAGILALARFLKRKLGVQEVNYG